jgi:urocanate hydratase
MNRESERVPGTTTPSSSAKPIRAPHGTTLSCKAWPQEAVLRLLMNSLDPDVHDSPPRDLQNFNEIVASLQSLEGNQTLLVRANDLEVVHTSAESPRAIAASSGETNWISIGPQASLPALAEMISAAAGAPSNGNLAGKLIVSASMSRACAAVSLAATMHGAAFLGIDASSEIIKRRVKNGYCDVMVNDLDEALRILKNGVRKREPASVGLVGARRKIVAELADRGLVPDILVDEIRPNNRDQNISAALVTLQSYGTLVIAPEEAIHSADSARRTILCIALSGEPSDIQRVDRLLLEIFPANEGLARLIKTAQRRIRHQGLPARACALNLTESRMFAAALNASISRNEFKAPVVLTSARPCDAASLSLDLDSLIAIANGAVLAIFRSSGGLTVTRALVLDGSLDAAAHIARVFET